MSVGRNLQEMENVVTKGAVAAEPMQKLATGIAPGQTGSWEDLGGPTPDNYRPDDDSAKLSTPGATLKSVKNVVNKGAAPAQAVAKEESEYDDEVVAEAAEEEEKEKGKDEGGKHKEGKHKKGKEEPGEGADEEDDEDGMKKEEFDIEEDINALIAGEELSEEFQEKARTIFEAAIKTKVAEIKEQLESAYEEQLIEELTTIKSELVERLDAYLEYAADEWMQENTLAIESGLKTEMTESFLQGMKGLFEDHYVTIPEERYDVIENMVDKLDEMETKLNEQIEKNIALNKRLAESVTDVIFAEVSEGLALSQKDKLASLAENVEFDGEANYREKLVTLRNSYFSPTAGAQRNISENLSEEVDSDVNTPVISEGLMNSYLQTLQRVSKK
jgi:SHS2 domain-containing protein